MASNLLQETRQQISRLARELDRAARSELAPQDFFARTLDVTLSALAADEATLWLDRDGALAAETVRDAQRRDLPASRAADTSAEQLQQILSGGRPAILAPPADSDTAAGPLRLFAPIGSTARWRGLVEIRQRPSISPEARSGQLKFVAQAAQSVSDFLERQELAELREQLAWHDRAVALIALARMQPTSAGIAYTLVNDALALAGCDRLSLVDCRSRRPRLLAISGQDRIDLRAQLVRSLERLVAASSLGQQPIWAVGATDSISPGAQAAVTAHLQVGGAARLAVVPCRPAIDRANPDDARPLPAARSQTWLVAEWFEPVPINTATRRPLERLAAQAAPLFDLPSRQGLVQKSLAVMRPLVKLAVVLGVLGSLGAALAWTPADFQVAAKGTLQPEFRRDVFAGADGEVAQVLVEHQDPVAMGAPLVELASEELEYQLASLTGRRQQTEKSIEVLGASQLGSARLPAEQRSQLASQLQTLEESLAGFTEQERLIRRQIGQLSVTSPIAGQVLTWNVDGLLRSRPVRRGQRLLTVANLSGPWQVEARVDDDRVGHLLAAQHESGTCLPVEFAVLTDPARTYRGTLVTIGGRAELDAAGRNTLPITIRIEPGQLDREQLRPGATVRLKIHCGQRSLGYVWFHDLWDWCQREILFPIL